MPRNIVRVAQRAERAAEDRDTTPSWKASAQDALDELWVCERMIHILFDSSLHERRPFSDRACVAAAIYFILHTVGSHYTYSHVPIGDWARETETGDRAELEDLPEDLPFWKDIAATAENCLGACWRVRRCAFVSGQTRTDHADSTPQTRDG